MSTTALILAAGRGTRLSPHTDRIPKCLVPLLGQSLLERQCRALRRAGVEDVRVLTGYRAAAVEAAIAAIAAIAGLGCSTIHNPRFATTNMVATLFCAGALMTGAADLLIVYGDIVFEPRIVRALLAEQAPLSTAVDRGWHRCWSLRMAEPLDDAETLRLSPDGHVVELGGRPASLGEIEGQYMGLTKVRADHAPRLLAAWEALDPTARYGGRDKASMFMTDFFTALLARGWRLKAVPVERGWLELDTASDLDLYHQLFARGELATFYDPAEPAAA